MRTFLLLAGLSLATAWTGSAHAQQMGNSSGIGNIIRFPKSVNVNVTPNITNNSPMDYRIPNAPIGATTSRPNLTGSAFPYKINSMFFQPQRTNFISSTQTFGSSTFPTPAQMQAAAPNYFRAFQMYRAAPIQP